MSHPALDIVATVAAIVALPLALLWPHGRAAPAPAFDPHEIPELVRVAALDAPEPLLPPGPAAACGASIVIRDALVDPDRRPDRGGEEVTLVNLGAAPVDLAGWRLACGRRERLLPEWPLGPGETVTLGGDGPLTLGTLRLANKAGEIELTDPCGLVRARLGWGGACPRPPPGWRLTAPGQKKVGPARSMTGGAAGGCGQT